MQTNTGTTQREQGEQARMRALVRFNGLTFHGLVAASFLETAVPQHVDRIARIFAHEPAARLWLEQAWWPRRAELGRCLREYVESTWPEFDWNAAHVDFQAGYRPRAWQEVPDAGAAREALALCATEAQAAMFYRALANSADEPALRALARRAADEHAEFFDFFRMMFEGRRRSGRAGFVASWRTITATCRSARDHDVAAAFAAIGQNWKQASIVPGFDYPEFLRRMAPLLRRHAGLGAIDRLLFSAWLEDSNSRGRKTDGTGHALQPALRPVAAQA